MSELANCHADLPYKKAVEEFAKLMAVAIAKRKERLGERAEHQLFNLMNFLTIETGWFKTPGSSKYHMCIEGGLLIHSVKVCQKALELADLWAPSLYKDSVILCSMFHDLGKTWGRTSHIFGGEKGNKNFILPRYVENNPGIDGSYPDPKQKGPYRVEETTGMEIAVRSLRMVEKYVDLSDAEAQSIHGHDHQYIASNGCYQHKETPLMLITHTADFWVGHVLEGGLDMNVDNQAHFVPWSSDSIQKENPSG